MEKQSEKSALSVQNLESLVVKNFKCFKDFEVQFGKLTVMSGYNGAGKSTAIQPILLLSQVMRDAPTNKGQFGKYWPLNGELVKLGTGGDVLHSPLTTYLLEESNNQEIEFMFGLKDKKSVSFKLDVEGEKDFLSCKRAFNEDILRSLDFISKLSFIGAKRNNDESLHPRPINSSYSKIDIGADGRYARFLYEMAIDEKDSFRSEVDDWLNFISTGAKARVLPLSNPKSLKLKFQLPSTLIEVIPSNVGNGLTSAFPIIVSSLIARSGDIMILDSPESHLHPRAQSRMGWMIAQIAGRGVQIILETHSDHVLNGIRLAVKEGKLRPDDLRLLCFTGNNNGDGGVIRPRIDKYGNLDKWPIGFFDQMEIDILKILEVG